MYSPQRHLHAYSALRCSALFPDRGIVYKMSYHVRVEPPGLCLSLWAEGVAQQPCSKISTFVRDGHRRPNGVAGYMHACACSTRIYVQYFAAPIAYADPLPRSLSLAISLPLTQ